MRRWLWLAIARVPASPREAPSTPRCSDRLGARASLSCKNDASERIVCHWTDQPGVQFCCASRFADGIAIGRLLDAALLPGDRPSTANATRNSAPSLRRAADAHQRRGLPTTDSRI